jgi:hypothetical protein
VTRLRALFGCALLMASSVVVSLALSVAANATVNGGDVTLVCAGTTSGTTFTLAANCDTTAPLTVPGGETVDGGGHTITAHDPSGGNFSGAVLTNTGSSMQIQNLTIEGTGFAIDCGVSQLMGIFFLNATGSLSNVTVKNITQHSGCPLGQAIRANSVDGTHRTVTLTNVTATNYQKSALVASGTITVNVTGSTFGPPDNLTGVITENGVQYGGTGVNAGSGGTVSGSVIYGNGFGEASDDSTAVLLYGASGVTLRSDTITGQGTDVGVSATASSTGVVIDRNQIGRESPDSPDTFGIGVKVDTGSAATVTCNTFTGWRTDLTVAGSAAQQALCITTTDLPSGTVHVPYSGALAAVGGTAPYAWSLASGSLPPGLALSASGTITGTPTTSGTFTFAIKVTDSAAGTATMSFTITVAAGTQGYWLGAGDGGVFTFGVAAFHGSTGNLVLNAPIVGIASTPAGGYWLVGSDGGVFSFGAPFFGSLGGRPLEAPIVGIAASPEGDGYYLVGADGSVFAFGAAVFQGSMHGQLLNKPIVGIAVTADNGGYDLVASDGGVFAFGDARFQGSMGATPLNMPVVGIAVDTVTSGYWLVAADGGVFAFAAPFLGSMGGVTLNAPVVGMAATADDNGYRLVGSDGGVFCFGIAEFHGSMGGTSLNKPAVGISSIGP